MKNIKNITLLATLVASILSSPVMFAGPIFSAQTIKNLYSYVGLPTSIVAVVAGLAGIRHFMIKPRTALNLGIHTIPAQEIIHPSLSLITIGLTGAIIALVKLTKNNNDKTK